MTILPKLLEQLDAGGIVIIPIIAVGLVMWWLILVKLLSLVQLRKHERSMAEFTSNPPPEWHWQHQLTTSYVNLRCDDDEINHAVMATLSATCRDSIAKGIATIALLAATAPLLGLLGTVTGMITTFTTIAEFGTGNARGLAEGISQALITTQGGLLIAIPGYIAVTMLQRRISRLHQRIDQFLTYIETEPDVIPAILQSTTSQRGTTHG